jgi:phosphate-selective porin OprO and OprP
VKRLLWAWLVLAVSAPPAAAQTSEPNAPAPVDATASQQDDDPDEAPPVRFAFPDRPSLRFGSVLRIDFRLRLQGDRHSYSPAEVSDDPAWEMSRRRVGIQGTAFEHVEYELEREIRKRSLWRDAFVNFRYFDDYQVQGGKFKVPFSQERLTGSTDLDFVYRANVVDTLAPARDIGVTLHGRFNQRAIGYDVGVFRNDGEAARFDFNPGAGQTVAARLAGRPLRLTAATGSTREMEVAVAVTASEVPDGLNSLRGRTVFREQFFAPVYVNGRRVRLGLDADWRPGPFSLKAEFIRVTDERKNQGIFDEDLPVLVSRGWYVSGTWVLTGESKFDGIAPRRPLLRGGVGGIELAARLERLGFGSSLEGEPELPTPRAPNLLEAGLRAWTFGVNWYVNQWIKIQLNAVREQFEDPDRSPVAGRDVFWTRVVRLQFVM